MLTYCEIGQNQAAPSAVRRNYFRAKGHGSKIIPSYSSELNA